MSSFWLRVAGVPATEIAAHTAPTWEMGADGGCLSAEFAFALSRRSQHHALRPGSLVEILCGPVAVWMGVLSEPDRSTWECHAYGLSVDLRGYLALTAAGAVSRDLGESVAQAALRGWWGANNTPITGPVAGSADGNPITVGDLLDQYAEQTGQRWGTTGRGVLYVRPDPTAPSLAIAPGAASFSPANENAPKRLAGRYFDGALYLTAYAGVGAPEEAVDLTDRGTLTLSAAEAILTGQLARTGPTGWTGSATLHREHLTTTGGQAVNLAVNHTGNMVRAHGMADGLVSFAPWQDVVIGKTRYTAGEDTIYVEPINAAPRTLTDVIAAA